MADVKKKMKKRRSLQALRGSLSAHRSYPFFARQKWCFNVSINGYKEIKQ